MLVDLNGYTQHSREQIFALRPAPVQINYLGYPGTLGADWYDFALVDRFSAPDALQPFFTERLLQLPHMSFPSNPGRLPGGTPPTRAECGLPDDAFVFACFNNAFKILPDVFAAWMRLLLAVEGSVLWLLEAGADAEANLRREAAAAGIDPARLVFAPRVSPVERHVARIAAADLVVDSFPYGAHTTANDALLAGVPLVTRCRRDAGEPHRGQPAARDRRAGAGDLGPGRPTRHSPAGSRRAPASLPASAPGSSRIERAFRCSTRRASPGTSRRRCCAPGPQSPELDGNSCRLWLTKTIGYNMVD